MATKTTPPPDGSHTTPGVRGHQTVFVVHSPSAPVRPLLDFLRCLDLAPLDWEDCVRQTGRPAPRTADVVAAGLDRAWAVVVLLTPDDAIAPDHPGALPRRRPDADVLVRLGIAVGGAGSRQVVLVKVGDVHLPEHLAGVDIVELDESPQQRKKFVSRLRSARCDVNDIGGDWLSISFESLLRYARRR